MKRLHKVHKTTKHALRVTIFIVAAVIVLILRRLGYTSGFWGISGELIASTVVDRILPGGSFFGDVNS